MTNLINQRTFDPDTRAELTVEVNRGLVFGTLHGLIQFR